jgi:hypothetical protein
MAEVVWIVEGGGLRVLPGDGSSVVVLPHATPVDREAFPGKLFVSLEQLKAERPELIGEVVQKKGLEEAIAEAKGKKK